MLEWAAFLLSGVRSLIDDILHSSLWTYFATYTWIDLLLAGILLLSTLFGWIRGMVREFFSLVSWLLAFWVAHAWSEKLVNALHPWIAQEVLRWVLAFLLIFVGVLILVRLVSTLLQRIVKKIGLGSLDGLLGALFGLLRGGLVVLALLLLAGLTPLPYQASWKEARLLPYAMPGVHRVLGWLPPALSRLFHY